MLSRSRPVVDRLKVFRGGGIYAVALVAIPEALLAELRRRGVDVESWIVDVLAKALQLDPKTSAVAHMELAERHLEEGKALADRDPVQASEKLYKAAEEAVKALAICLGLDVVEKVEARGRWTAAELDRSARDAASRLGSWLLDAWDHAWALHVWGFHEAKLDSDSVKARMPHIARLVEEAKKACA